MDTVPPQLGCRIGLLRFLEADLGVRIMHFFYDRFFAVDVQVTVFRINGHLNDGRITGVIAPVRGHQCIFDGFQDHGARQLFLRTDLVDSHNQVAFHTWNLSCDKTLLLAMCIRPLQQEKWGRPHFPGTHASFHNWTECSIDRLELQVGKCTN